MAAPLFLLAPPRSYTSLINAMIGQHPQAFGLPELNLFNVDVLQDFWISKDEVRQHPIRRHGILRTVAEVYGGEQTKDTIAMAMHWASARENEATSTIFRELVDKLHPLIAVEKSPGYTFAIERLSKALETFPEARFLHLVRHPIPQCKSVLQIEDGVFALMVNAFDFTENEAVIEPQISWYDINVNILNFLDIVPEDQKLRMRGEDIMGDPRGKFAEICAWLGIRGDEDAIDEMMHPELSPFACYGPLNAFLGNDPNFLRGSTFRPHVPIVPELDSELPWRSDGKKLMPEVVKMAMEFGYS